MADINKCNSNIFEWENDDKPQELIGSQTLRQPHLRLIHLIAWLLRRWQALGARLREVDMMSNHIAILEAPEMFVG